MTTTPNITTARRASLRSRHPIFYYMIAFVAGMIALMIASAIVAGTFKAIAGSHLGNQIVIEKTGSAYHDCTAFAQARGFAVDVCESLNPDSKTAKTNCAEEKASGEAQVDCPSKPSDQASSFNDGFATSKQDDCAQGDQTACQWVRNSH